MESQQSESQQSALENQANLARSSQDDDKGATWVATLAFSITAGPHAVPSARRSLEGLRKLLEPDVFDDLRIVISELVKNGAQHAARGPAGKISFEVSVSSKVRATVTDFGSGFKQWSMKPAPQRELGLGLFLVDRLTDSWGVLHEGGTHVWLEIDHGKRRPPSA
jgi:anti-sigma regulatory factor (Ser/Thr protein kinase)